MKTVKSLKDITTLEVNDVIVFGNLKYTVVVGRYGYYLSSSDFCNTRIFDTLNVNKNKFIKSLGIHANYEGAFPETSSLEALTAIVSALFKEYEKQNELPKTWEEFCERNKNIPVFKLTTVSSINTDFLTHSNMDKNTCRSRQEAEAFLALMQLRLLRKAYVGNWEPDWTCDELVHSVGYNYFSNELVIESSTIWGNCMSFPTKKLANQFLTNFKDLLEIAKPLL